MKTIIILGLLIAAVLLCEKYKERLPSPVRGIYALWEKFAKAFGLVMSTIILTVFWIVMIGIYAVISKIITLFQKKNPSDTYWIPSEPHPVEAMSRQF